MDIKKSYLFVTWEGGGNVPPVLGVARRLVDKGHRVRILSEPCLRDEVEAMGAEFISFKAHFIRTNRKLDLIKDWDAGPMNLATFDNILFGPAKTVAQETVQAIQSAPTDVVVADLMMIGSMIAAESQRLPLAILFHMPEYLPGPNRPPGGFGVKPRKSPISRIRDSGLAFIFKRVTAKYLSHVNEVRAFFKLAPVSSFESIYHSSDLRLIQTSEAFDWSISPKPDNLRYVGPVFDDPDWTGDENIVMEMPSEDKPLVIVSLSSTFQNQRASIENSMSALSDLPVYGVVTLGPAMAQESFPLLDNVRVVAAFPHSKLMPKAKAIITHAGHGTIMKALQHGIPLVCLPMGRDQTDNSALVEYHGVGIKLSAKANPQQIAKAVVQVLKDPKFAKNARRLRDHILSDAKGDKAVLELESL
jgi:MGT family glycosyltransferase